MRSLTGKWMPLRIPPRKKRTALLRELKECFRRARSQPTDQLISTINPVLRGWVNYFATGEFWAPPRGYAVYAPVQE